MESQVQTPPTKVETVLKNKDTIFFETTSLELANKIRTSIMNHYSTLRPWVFVNKLWNGIEQNDYYVISVMNEHNHVFDQITIDAIQLHIFNINMEHSLKDVKEKKLDVVWV
jgi:hypothetical protein